MSWPQTKISIPGYDEGQDGTTHAKRMRAELTLKDKRSLWSSPAPSTLRKVHVLPIEIVWNFI